MADLYLLRGENTGTPGTIVDDVGTLSWTGTGTNFTQQTTTKKFQTGAYFANSTGNANAEGIESSAFSHSGDFTATFWAKGGSSLSGQFWVWNYGERDVAGSLTLIISPGSFATLVCWTGGGAGNDCGFTSTSSDFAQFIASGGAIIEIQRVSGVMEWAIENGSGSMVKMGTLSHTVVTGKKVCMYRCPVDAGHTSFTGGWDGYVDSLYGKDGGVLYGTYPHSARTSEFSLSGGGVTANLSVTDATDTLSSTATAAISAALTRTDATDTLSATSTEPVTASLTRTDATDTLGSTATAAISAALSRTDATDTLSASVTVAVAVNLSTTDATDTLSSDAVVGAAGVICDLSVTDAADTLGSTATVAVAVNLSRTDATDALAATSTSVVAANFSRTDATDTLTSTTTEPVTVNFAQTDATDTLDSALTTAGDITANFSQTDATDTLQSQATLEGDRQGHGGRNAGRMDFRLYDDVDMRERIARLAVTDADDTLQATASAAYPERYVSANLFDGDDVAEAAAVVVPWPALELMREHRLERWFPKGRGPRSLSE